jgi:hypothetical protein
MAPGCVPLAALIVALVLVAFVPPPAHEVHSFGATPLKASLVASDLFGYLEIQPTQSISDLRCSVWAYKHAGTACSADTGQTYFPSVTQAPNTLYLIWTGCISWSGHGAILNWQGYNVEYFPSNRRLVIHCYLAEGWLAPHQMLWGSAGEPPDNLLVISTGSIGRGDVQIFEDDRLEHLVGDGSTEFKLADAAIS